MTRSTQAPRVSHSLRVALIAGGLWRGGAEKQFVYMVRALARRGVDVRCYSLTRGDVYEDEVRRAGADPVWIGRRGSPAWRLARLTRELRRFRPQLVQSGHFFVNLYTALGARACGAVSLGAVRNDAIFDVRENGRWGPWLLRMPTVLIANSSAACRNARSFGRSAQDVLLLPNVIDLEEFDAARAREARPAVWPPAPVAITVGRLVRAKRFDRFLDGLAQARRQTPALSGVIVGEGPERGPLEAHAARLGLGADAVRFMGARSDVPALLGHADLFVLCSEHEGFPNVLLEAMAARLPVVTTPAGDAATVLLPNVTGYVVDYDDTAALAARMSWLARSADQRRVVGTAGRKRVEALFGTEQLDERLFDAYQRAMARASKGRLAHVPPSAAGELAARPEVSPPR